MTKIQPLWKKHPLYTQGHIELVPIEWVWKIRGTDVDAQADLMNGQLVDLDTLWNNLLQEGMHEPLIVRVGLKNKKYRLEAGNHRVQVLYNHGVKMVPVTVQVKEDCGPSAPNPMDIGTHAFDVGDNLRITSISQEFMKPSDVFRDLRVRKSLLRYIKIIAYGVFSVSILFFLYYTISPLFITIRVNEAAPVTTSTNATSTTENQPVTVSYETSPKQLIDTPLHPASGTVRVVSSGNSHFIRYENFKTINGPDIFVYLSKDVDANDFINLGPVKATEGNVNYEIPAGVDPRDYPYALVWCKQFGVLFNSAQLY